MSFSKYPTKASELASRSRAKYDSNGNLPAFYLAPKDGYIEQALSIAQAPQLQVDGHFVTPTEDLIKARNILSSRGSRQDYSTEVSAIDKALLARKGALS